MNILSNIRNLSLRKAIKDVFAIEIVDADKLAGGIVYNACHITYKRNKIILGKTLIDVKEETIAAWLQPLINPTTIVLININSDKVLTRIGNKTIADIKEIIANANSADFIGNSYSIEQDNVLTSYTRLAYIDILLEGLSFLKKNISEIVIGPLPILGSYHLAFKPDANNECMVKFTNHVFYFNNNKLISYQRSGYVPGSTDQIMFGQEAAPEQLLMAYSQAINFLLLPNHVFGIQQDILQQNKADIFYTLLSKWLILASLFVLFIMLAVSSILFSHYNDKYNNVQIEYESRKKSLDLIQLNNKKTALYKKVLTENGLDQASYVSFFSDQITKDLSDNIYLNALDINPVDKNADEEEMIFNNDKIFIEGTCYSTIDLNEWIGKLREYSWIKKVNINEYTQTGTNGLSSFKLEVQKNSKYEYK